MKLSKTIFIFFCCTLMSFCVKAEIGCQVEDGRVYTGLLGLGTPYRSVCSGTVGDYGIYANVIGPAGGLPCIAVLQLLPLKNILGTPVNYSLLECSIDDYVPLFAILVACIGLLHMTRENKSAL